MKKSDDYRSLRQELQKMDCVGFRSRNDIIRLRKILLNIITITNNERIMNEAICFYNAIPTMKKEYLNVDSGDIAFMEFDWDYSGIAWKLKNFVSIL